MVSTLQFPWIFQRWSLWCCSLCRSGAHLVPFCGLCYIYPKNSACLWNRLRDTLYLNKLKHFPRSGLELSVLAANTRLFGT